MFIHIPLPANSNAQRHLEHIAVDPDPPESGGVAVAPAFPRRSVALCRNQGQIWPESWKAMS